MKPIAKPLIWAAVILVYALAIAGGWFEEDGAGTMLIILPMLAWMATNGSRGCAPCPLLRRQREDA